jgi:hypothetical protein
MRTVTALKDLSQPHDDTPPIPNALHGHAMVEQVTRTGITREGNPEVELVLTVDVAGRSATRRPFARCCRDIACRIDPDDPLNIAFGDKALM